MKKNVVLSALLAVSLASASAAGLAQDRQDRDRGDRGHDMRDRGRDMRDRGRDMHDERGAGPDHRWHRGDRLPPEYRHRNYVVDDWREHHLDAPPRGYHWVQTGGDYVLAAIATGVILKIVLGN